MDVQATQPSWHVHLKLQLYWGTNNITEVVKDGDILAVNGITGEVIINPTDEQAAEFKAAGEAYAKQKLNGHF